MTIYNYITLISAALMIFLILIQTRGTDKTIFQLTIVCAVVFALSLIVGIIV